MISRIDYKISFVKQIDSWNNAFGRLKNLDLKNRTSWRVTINSNMDFMIIGIATSKLNLK